MTVYKGSNTREIAFPLGGIGSGCVSLAGNGRLIDWEIFNHPDKSRNNGFTHFAIKAECKGELIDARVLQGDLLERPGGTYNIRDRLRKKHSGFGAGPDSETLGGMPHFADTQFSGEFPLAMMSFADAHFPGVVNLTAFNPFIPSNEDDSSLPAAFFEWEIENTQPDDLDYTLCFSVGNPLFEARASNSYQKVAGNHAMHFTQSTYDKNSPFFGELSVATDANDVSYQEYWYRGSWFDSLSLFWREFCEQLRFENRHYDGISPQVQDCATLAAHIHIPAGQRRKVRFLLSWYFPVTYNYWQRWYAKEKHELVNYEDYAGQAVWRNYYATQFASSKNIVDYGLHHWQRLASQTRQFHDALFSSSLPAALLDAVSANLAALKSPTCLRLEGGEFYAWEGVLNDLGCCEGSCIHVWNYACALPFLFPRLERSMRDLNQHYNLAASGSLSFRLMLPLGTNRFAFRACADGQFGEIIKIYRDWCLCGDNQWLQEKWPAVESMMAFTWSTENEDKWDPDCTGLLTGRQHHTLDMELFGANAWLTGLYLAGLKAAEKIAQVLGHTDQATQYRNIFERGRTVANTLLFNGDYFHQNIDLSDKSLLAPYYVEHEQTWNNDQGNIYDFYWNEEKGQIKYQIGDGCNIDQLMGQWMAAYCGLEDVFDAGKVEKSLQAIYRNNFRSMREHTNPCRLFAYNDEKGTTICSWLGVEKPMIPIPYAEETMTGFEYQFAAHLIQAGLEREGVEVTTAIRQRFNGENRNPWNEFECGSNYARSMASYGLLLASSGFIYNLSQHFIGFHPPQQRDGQCFFWSLDGAWGTVEWHSKGCVLKVIYGALALQQFSFPWPSTTLEVNKNQQLQSGHLDGDIYYFSNLLILNAADELTFYYQQ